MTWTWADVIYLGVCGVFLVPLALALLWRWWRMCWEMFHD